MTLPTIASLQDQPKTVMKKVIRKHLVFAFRLHGAPCVGDTGENGLKRRNSQLVDRCVRHFISICVWILYPETSHFGGRGEGRGAS